MNRHFISRTLWMAWVVLLLAPILAFAQSPYAGTYMGTYHGPGDDGECQPAGRCEPPRRLQRNKFGRMCLLTLQCR